MARSSMTRIAITTGVSGAPRRPDSVSTLAATPEDVTHVTAPRMTAVGGDQPIMSPASSPGV